MDLPAELVPQLKKQFFSAITSKVDAFHVLSVISDGEAATQDEARYLTQAAKLLRVPIGGDMVWAKCMGMLSADAGHQALALSYLNDGLKIAGLTPVTDLESSKSSVVDLIDHIINREPVLTLAAMCQCPACGFVYGEMK